MSWTLFVLAAVFLLLGQATEDPRLMVQVTTWNVHNTQPPDDLRRLVGLERSPDVIAIGLQEVAVLPHEAILHSIHTDQWTQALDDTLLNKGYSKVRTVAMIGIVLNVYVKDKHNAHVVVLDKARVRTGFKGLYGNKGGVSLTVLLYGSPVTFVAAHLPAKDDNLDKRVEDFHIIEKRRGRSCAQEDYTFWLGDLNFRLKDHSANSIQHMIQKGFLSTLLVTDQLNEVRSEGRAFKGYEEQEITFKPTYRFIVDTNTQDLERRPAWTDRVLYRAGPGREIQPLHYGSIPEYSASDHKPVEALFLISVAA